MDKPIIDPRMREFLTARQAEIVDAVETHPSASAAAKALGVSYGTVSNTLARIRAAQSAKGFAPGHWENGAAPGYLIGKVTVHRKGDGTVLQTWERQHPDAAFLDAVREAVEAGFGREPIMPVSVAPPMPGRDRDVIPWIEIGDAHLGMLAHEAETGSNFDLKIAERELCAAFAMLIDEGGEHERGVINDLGDFTHYENFKQETEASGHRLDGDGRFPRMIEVYVRVMRFVVEKALEKWDTVDVIINQGNHSRTNDIWMAVALKLAYGHTGRVNVLNNHSPFIGYRMGRTFVMTHHGDKCPPQRLADVMSTDFAKDWGETLFRYCDTGHVHHGKRSLEHAGVQMESFNTLAPRDKWAHDNGYRSRQCMTRVDRSRTYGEIGRQTLPIERVRDVIRLAHTSIGKAAPYEPREARAFVA
jgi:hypothetical protein